MRPHFVFYHSFVVNLASAVILCFAEGRVRLEREEFVAVRADPRQNEMMRLPCSRRFAASIGLLTGFPLGR